MYGDSVMARILKRFSLLSPMTRQSLTAKMAVFCDHSPLKNARAS
jgi:hypothetical protein